MMDIVRVVNCGGLRSNGLQEGMTREMLRGGEGWW